MTSWLWVLELISRSICAHQYWSVSQTQDSAYNVSYCPVSHTQLHSLCVCWACKLFSAWPLIFPYDLDTVIFHATLRTKWPMQHTHTLCHEGTCPLSIMLCLHPQLCYCEWNVTQRVSHSSPSSSSNPAVWGSIHPVPCGRLNAFFLNVLFFMVPLVMPLLLVSNRFHGLR